MSSIFRDNEELRSIISYLNIKENINNLFDYKELTIKDFWKEDFLEKFELIATNLKNEKIILLSVPINSKCSPEILENSIVLQKINRMFEILNLIKRQEELQKEFSSFDNFLSSYKC